MGFWDPILDPMADFVRGVGGDIADAGTDAWNSLQYLIDDPANAIGNLPNDLGDMGNAYVEHFPTSLDELARHATEDPLWFVMSGMGGVAGAAGMAGRLGRAGRPLPRPMPDTPSMSWLIEQAQDNPRFTTGDYPFGYEGPDPGLYDRPQFHDPGDPLSPYRDFEPMDPDMLEPMPPDLGGVFDDGGWSAGLRGRGERFYYDRLDPIIQRLLHEERGGGQFWTGDPADMPEGYTRLPKRTPDDLGEPNTGFGDKWEGGPGEDRYVWTTKKGDNIFSPQGKNVADLMAGSSLDELRQRPSVSPQAAFVEAAIDDRIRARRRQMGEAQDFTGNDVGVKAQGGGTEIVHRPNRLYEAQYAAKEFDPEWYKSRTPRLPPELNRELARLEFEEALARAARRGAPESAYPKPPREPGSRRPYTETRTDINSVDEAVDRPGPRRIEYEEGKERGAMLRSEYEEARGTPYNMFADTTKRQGEIDAEIYPYLIERDPVPHITPERIAPPQNSLKGLSTAEREGYGRFVPEGYRQRREPPPPYPSRMPEGKPMRGGNTPRRGPSVQENIERMQRETARARLSRLLLMETGY